MNPLPRVRVLAIVLVAVLVLLLAAYLFRSRSWSNPELGEFELLYRWGSPRFIQIDVNGDGRIDARYRISGPGDYSSSHWNWDVGWESSRCDGVLDVHLRKAPDIGLIVAVDTDRNGETDYVVRGIKAESYLKNRDVYPACEHQKSSTSPDEK